MGVISPEAIVKKSVFYNQKGIDISTIGVGADINHALLQQIAKKGKGLNHFVGSHAEDIVKVFENELESLLSPIAKDVVLELEYPKGMDLSGILGYNPILGSNKISIPLNHINSGLTQVVLLEFKLNGTNKPLPVKARLNYYSPNLKQQNSMDLVAMVSSPTQANPAILNQEIKKNYAIGNMAVALKTMGELVGDKKFTDAVLTLESAIKSIEREFPNLKDKDILRVKEILYDNYTRFKDWLDLQAASR